MAKERTQILSLSSDQRSECEELSKASGSGWWRIQKGDIPSFVPEGMRPKLDGGVMILSGSSSGTTYLMFGAERVDAPDVDIHPFGVVVFPSGASTGMAVVHHGGWVERTTPLPSDFTDIASSCSTGSYFFSRPPERKTSGSLDELGQGQRGAFESIMSSLSAPPGGSAA